MISFFLSSFWLAAGLLFLNACAPLAPTLASPEGSVGDMREVHSSSASFSSYAHNATDSERLLQLWQRRAQKGFIDDYPIGSGDVLEISVSGMEEISTRTVRVSSEGTISLPFVGVLQASGLTEKELREEIGRRLEKNYMYNPQVNLFVREYRSRQVAVLGAVGKPGLYSLVGSGDTLLDVISQAGGMTDNAASKILFIPAEPAEKEKAKEIVSSLPPQLVSEGSSPLILKSVDPLLIDLKSRKPGSEIYLALPARPGDVILVPGGGDVLVEGWVEKPGSYKITPVLTVLGAVAAAGGPLFPADTSSVKVIRTDKRGEKIFFLVDLESIKRGEAQDIPVQEGDVIDVSSSAPKLVGYGLYRFFSTIINIGASVRLAK